MKNLSKQFIVAIIALAILGYVGLQISLSTKDAVQVENAMYAQAKKTISTDAYIFRDEIPIISNTNGTVCYFFDDGEKIAKGQPIVTTYALSTDADVQKKINEINKKIKILEKSSTNSNISAGDLNNMDNAITNGVVNIAKAIGSKSIGNVDLQEYDLLIALNKKRSAMATINGYEMQIEQKKAEKSRLQSQLSGSSDVQNAASAGYLYSYVDGYENIFTADLLKKMTIEDYFSLEGREPDKSMLASAVGKLVISSKWSITICLDKREASRLITNNKNSSFYKVTFPYSGSRTVNMKLERTISQTNFDKTVLVFSSSEIIDNFNYTRTQSVNITESSFSGIKIPVSALRMIDGKSGVYALDGNVVVYKQATVLYQENGYYICALPDKNNLSYVDKNKLSLYDAIVVSGKNIFVGKILS